MQRSWVTYLEVPALLLTPAALVVCAVAQLEQSALLSLVVVVASLAVFVSGWEVSMPSVKQIMPTVVLAALAAAGRILFAPIPDFKPVTAICIIAGIMFGRRSGFMVGALAALTSNLFFGQGPWTPWQMYAWGLTGYLAGVLADNGLFKRSGFLLYGYSFVAPLLYGLLLNGWYVIGFVHPITVASVLSAYLAALPLDLIHCTATLVFMLLLYAPWRRKLERIRNKHDLRVQ